MDNTSLRERAETVGRASNVAELRRLMDVQAKEVAELVGTPRLSHAQWARLGITVQAKSMMSAGAGIDLGSTCVVYVRESDAAVRQRFTVAHEIGHFLLRGVHVRQQISLERRYEERLCDEFASAVLIPRGRLYSLI